MNFVNQSQDMFSPICRTPEKTRGVLPSSDSIRWSPQTPANLGKRSSLNEEKDSCCLSCGINLHGAGGTHEVQTNETLATKIYLPVKSSLLTEYCRLL